MIKQANMTDCVQVKAIKQDYTRVVVRSNYLIIEVAVFLILSDIDTLSISVKFR